MSEFGESLEDMDMMAFLNIRTFVEDALEAKGAVITDADVGGGRAGLGFTVEGMPFGLHIKPRAVRPATVITSTETEPPETA